MTFEEIYNNLSYKKIEKLYLSLSKEHYVLENDIDELLSELENENITLKEYKYLTRTITHKKIELQNKEAYSKGLLKAMELIYNS